MANEKIMRGIHYESVAGPLVPQIEKMIDIANRENAFVYESFNGVPFMVEPGAKPEDAKKHIQFASSKERKIAIYDTIRDFKVSDVLAGMEKLAKDNDIVIARVNGRDFRIFRGMTAQDALETLKTVSAMEPVVHEEKPKPEQPKQNAFANEYLEELHQKYLNAKREADEFVKTDTAPLYQSVMKIEAEIQAKKLEIGMSPSLEKQAELQKLEQRLIIVKMKHGMSLSQAQNLRRLEQAALEFWQKNQQIVNGGNQNS